MIIDFRDIIRNAVNAGESDAVIFTGSGCTAAVHKLIHALHLKQPPVCYIATIVCVIHYVYNVLPVWCPPMSPITVLPTLPSPKKEPN